MTASTITQSNTRDASCRSLILTFPLGRIVALPAGSALRPSGRALAAGRTVCVVCGFGIERGADRAPAAAGAAGTRCPPELPPPAAVAGAKGARVVDVREPDPRDALVAVGVDGDDLEGPMFVRDPPID